MSKLKIGSIIVATILITGCSTIPQSNTSTNVYRDNEPNLVGKSIAERINESQTAINDQLALLERIHSGGRVGVYSAVEHNNNLDARKGSEYTLPYDYAYNTFDIPSPSDQKFVAVEDSSKYSNNSNNGHLHQSNQSQHQPIQQVDTHAHTGQSTLITQQTVQTQVTTHPIPASTVSPALKNMKLPKNEATVQKVKRIEWKNNSLNALSKNLSEALGYELVIKKGSVEDKNVTFVAENKTLLEVVNQLSQESSSFADIVVIDENKTFNIFYK